MERMVNNNVRSVCVRRRKALGYVVVAVTAAVILGLWIKLSRVDSVPGFKVIPKNKPAPKKMEVIPTIQYVDYRTKEVRPGAIVNECPHKCELSYGIDNFEDKDIVIFHAPSIPKSLKPPKKGNGQVWVFFTQEAPLNHQTNFRKWNGLFNWTMTQRSDADALVPEGCFIARTAADPPPTNISGLWSKKTELVAWMVSNCRTQSKRETYVSKMKKYTDVHIYGLCGDRKSDDRPASYRLLTNRYSFTLAFENTLCNEYVSEKTFKLFVHGGKVVPVVRDHDRVFERLLPPRSYVNTADFPTVKEFVKHLKNVAANKTAYEQYFEWEKHYKIGSTYLLDKCRLCEMIHNREKHRHLYNKISDWFLGGNYKPRCHPPVDI